MSAKSLTRLAAYTVGLALWTSFAFISAQYAAAIVLYAFAYVVPSLGSLNESVSTTLFAALAYSLALVGAVYLPRIVGLRTSREELGVTRWPAWRDIGAFLLAIVPYILLTMLLVTVVDLIWAINTEQQQEIPFAQPVLRIEYIVAFVTLVVLAPLAEELLFRGYLLGKLQKKMHPYVAIGISALVFGAMHLPAKELQWAVAIDTFALGIVLGVLRVHTGSVWASVLLHSLKNGIAYYFLFIAPQFLGML